MKIFLLEDEIMLCDSIEKFLTKIGHHVQKSYRGDEALEAIEKERFDLLILDINVPNLDGFALVETLHQQHRFIPTIFISALTDIEDITRGFELGCKDYIKKPFHLQELKLRIEKLFSSSKELLHVRLSPNYSYSFETKTLYFQDAPVTLSKRQLQIIDLLARNRNLVVDYDMFREYVYSEEFVDNPTIRAEISRLKKALKEDFIINVRGVGYKIKNP